MLSNLLLMQLFDPSAVQGSKSQVVFDSNGALRVACSNFSKLQLSTALTSHLVVSQVAKLIEVRVIGLKEFSL